MPIPLELVTMGASFLASSFTTLVSSSMKARQQTFEHVLGKAMAQSDIADKAAARGKGDRGFQLTRRIIALGVIGAIIFATMILPIWKPDIPITVGLSEISGGFWFFSDPREVFNWYTFNGGVVMTPLMTHMGSAITGFFFGNQIAK